MTAASPPLQFGPRVEADAVSFRLWAPDARQVWLCLDGQPPRPMSRQADGFWGVRAEVSPGALYQFDVDGQKVSDPASRFQPGDIDGPSQVVDETAYRWRHPHWTGRAWEEAVIYEAHAGVCGGYAGLRERLPVLAALGITALELMPIAAFAGERNWGYDGVLPFAPARAYGERDALKALIDDAHGLGIMVFLDVVYNHFGPAGNFLPAYAPSFFDPERQTPWGAAIDFDQPAVRRFFAENALYWLEVFRFDGLRLDAVHAIKDQDWIVELAAEIRSRLPGRQVHLVVENEANAASLLRNGVTAQWNDDFHNVLHVLLTGETQAYYAGFTDQPAARLARCLAEGFIYQGEDFPGPGGAPRGQPSGDLPPTAFVAFLQNHDQTGNRARGDRLTTLARPDALRAAMALLLLAPQIPLLFMGEDVGAREPFLFFTDFEGALADAVREGRRAEFAASRDSDPSVPDPNAEATFNASIWTRCAPDAETWERLVTQLLDLRRARITPHLRGSASLGSRVLGPRAVLAQWRLCDGSVLTVAVNLDSSSVAAPLPDTPPVFGAGLTSGRLAAETTLAWIEP